MFCLFTSSNCIFDKKTNFTYFFSFRTQQNQIDKQYLTFWYQTIASCAIYVPTLISIFLIINFDTTGFMEEQWKCDTHIVFDSVEFKLHVLEIALMGFISLILSYNPNFLAGFESFVRNILRYIDKVLKYIVITTNLDVLKTQNLHHIFRYSKMEMKSRSQFYFSVDDILSDQKVEMRPKKSTSSACELGQSCE